VPALYSSTGEGQRQATGVLAGMKPPPPSLKRLATNSAPSQTIYHPFSQAILGL